MESSTVDAVNTRLKEYFGTDETGRPVFRIVWSDEQIEKRFGTFTEWYGPLFIREAQGMQECHKYDYIQHRWVLEKMMTAQTDCVIGLDLDNRCYEPVYTFEDKFGNPLPVEWWAAEMVVKRLLGVLTGSVERQTPGDVKRAEDAAYWKEVAYMENVIANEQGGDIATKLGAREAVVVI